MTEALYARGIPLAQWDKHNQPHADLIWRAGMSEQIAKLAAVATILPNYGEHDWPEPRVVGHHLSKSVRLPVTCFKLAPYDQVHAYVFVRDNFYNLKVAVVSDSPITIPYTVVHTEWSRAKYRHEVKRYTDYTGNSFPIGYNWYESWSSGTLFEHNDRIYRTGEYREVYCEGMDELGLGKETFKPYKDGDMKFVCEVAMYADVATILGHVIGSLERERFKRNEQRRDAEDAAREATS